MSSRIVRRKSRPSQLRAGEEPSPPGADPGDLLGQSADGMQAGTCETWAGLNLISRLCHHFERMCPSLPAPVEHSLDPLTLRPESRPSCLNEAAPANVQIWKLWSGLLHSIIVAITDRYKARSKLKTFEARNTWGIFLIIPE